MMFYNSKNRGITVRNAYRSLRDTKVFFNSGRTHTALSFRLSGYSIFEFQNKRVTAEAGSIAFIPPGVDYTIYQGNDEVIGLHLNVYGENENTIQIISSQDPGLFAELFNRIYLEWSEKRDGYENRCNSLLYTIFAELEHAENRLLDSRFRLIREGVLCMRTEFRDPEMTVAALAEKCGVSEVHFRRLFKEAYGISPLRQINLLRIQLAEELLEGGYDAIGEIAEKAGFRDQRYFSTCFKKETGITPSEYRANRCGCVRLVHSKKGSGTEE